MSKLALGTVQFGMSYGISNTIGQVGKNEAKKILAFAKQEGIDTLDTAMGYGNSEQVLGELGVNDFKIITKTSTLINDVDVVINNFYHSLNNLGVEHVEGLLIHNFNDIEEKKFSILQNKLYNLKKEGLIQKIGFSTYTPKQVDFLLENFDFDLIQVPFNVFDTRLIEGGQLQALKNKSVEIHARSVFLQGLLLSFDSLSDYFSTWDIQFEQYQEIVKVNELSLLDYALNFALNTQELDKILVGVDNVNQLTDIINSSKLDVDLDAFKIDDISLINPSLWSE